MKRIADTDRIAEPWGSRTPYAPEDEPTVHHAPGPSNWPVRVDEYLEQGVSPDDVQRWVGAACVLCSNGCSLQIAVKDDRMVGVRGQANGKTNHGRLGPKGLFGWQANRSGDRLTRPLIRRDGELVETDWDTAMTSVVDRSRRILDEVGPLGLGFYTSGQLFLEEYYTLAVIGKAGLGTPHMDGNTRLCTATAAQTMKESFGSDGQPGSYTDIDRCDTICLYGHNIAEQQTVLWMRMLDRLAGARPPRLVVVDPRRTKPAEVADVHLAVRNGTNIACMNAIEHELIRNGWIDKKFVAAHTVGFETLASVVADYPPDRVAEICGVDPDDIRRAARIIGESEHLLSTVLQGFYQSNQGTAAGVQVNNVHLLRAKIGYPGSGIYQMNGQPTAQNTRETGADGDLSAFRNWANPDHVRELADLWNVDPMIIPHWSPPSHAMQIFRYAETGSIRQLWISGTNPAVSMPDLGRIRSILSQDRLFVIVQDAFLTETARLADVVLPAAIWGEKTGTFTNVDRTVHLTDKAVDPPGEARSDLDIFLDYAERMGLTDRDGAPLIKWHDPESAFGAWRECTRGRPCDYTGITYERLRGSGGIQWPCNEDHPDGTQTMYEDHVFVTDADRCESYGDDLETGTPLSPEQYRALDPHGRALLKSCRYLPGPEVPGDGYPMRLTTGRTLYQFHTRTKTARAPQLQQAAPDAWAELHPSDAKALGIEEGDTIRLSSRRGRVEVPARISGIREGVVFVPFHYGYFDQPGRSGPDGRARAGNELTITEWDPVSKQPVFKVSAVRVEKVAGGTAPAPAPTTTASAPVDAVNRADLHPTAGGPAASAASYLDGEDR